MSPSRKTKVTCDHFAMSMAEVSLATLVTVCGSRAATGSADSWSQFMRVLVGSGSAGRQRDERAERGAGVRQRDLVAQPRLAGDARHEAPDALVAEERDVLA